MSTREARLNVPGGMFHAISRCAGGQFLIDAPSRDYYLEHLGRVLDRTDAQVLAWCLMSNHVHLVVQQGAEPLERLFKPLHTGFARFINRHHSRRGPVFSERPKTLLVDEDEWLLELIRYVHNNPVRAGVSRYARTSTWSSHQAYIGKRPAPAWLPLGYVLDDFGRSEAASRRKFDAFVDEGRREPRSALLCGETGAVARAEVHRWVGDGWRPHGGILGDETFQASVRADLNRVEKVMAGQGLAERAERPSRPPHISEAVDAVLAVLDLEPWAFEARPKQRRNVLARQLLVWTWVRRLGGTQADVARELGAGTGRVSRWYGRAVEAAPDLDALADAVVQEVARGQSSRGKKERRGFAVRYDVVVED